MSRSESTSPSPRRPAWRSAARIMGVVAAALLLAVLLTLWVRSAPHRPGRGAHGGGGQGGRPQVTVGVAKAVLGSVPIELSALGTVTPLATVNVNARVAGMLDTVAFREGQLVRRGQLLARIDPRPFQVVVQQAQGQLLRDQALLRNAKLDLTRFQTLKAQDSIAGQQVDTQAALVKQDEATVSADQAAVASAQLNLSFTRIASPVSGRVGLRQIDPGNQITANAATPIAVVTQIDPITVVFSLPQGDIPSVNRQGGSGLAVTAYDRAGGTALARGTLATLDNVIDTTTGTVKAKAPVRQRRRRPLPQPVRQRRDAGRHAVKPGDRSDHGDAPRAAGRLRLGAAGRQDGQGPAGQGRRGNRRNGVDRVRPERRRDGDHRRRRSPARRRQGHPARRAAPGSKAGWRRRRRHRRSAAAGPRPKWRCRPHEPVPPVHRAAGGDLAADGGDPAGRHRGLPLPAAVGPAGGRLPDHPGARPSIRAPAPR